jgi:chromosome partitioning protein
MRRGNGTDHRGGIMRVVVASNRGGGVGKTAIAVNLAALWGQGHRTLVIDIDEEGDASAGLGVEDTGEVLAEALLGRTSLEAAIRTSECGVDVAPAGEALSHVADRVRPDAIRRALESVRHRGYHMVVIDCPPALHEIVRAAWLAAPAVQAVVPVDGPKALRGVARLCHAWEDAGLDLEAMRIVLVRHDERRNLDRALERQARGLYGPAVLESRVRESVIVGESTARRQPLVLYAPTHPVTDDFRRLAREVARV